ncbi:DNA repair protein RecO [Oculatella sp. LEGE 06141]|uniref:DNA repair protein RecO n=1 Tax=Oculatella sp. LEGE 06141 TaxID=1828648 RepID=UPI00188154AC|nr:DNA repair protein RecO [Oculatella sp. LEGE 06141]MBE9181562.1 DNA repair protein RecO [Oculatella sp. LEGE 06141]
MSGTYKVTGINLKAMPLGETDRLLTILTQEMGLIRAVAPGARKHQSSLRGRSDLFVVNELLVAKGKSLDKIIQAESVESFPGLGQDLGKLTASQYLAELALYQALSDQPQAELLGLLSEHLRRLERLPKTATLASLTQAIFHLLVQAGVAPQVHACCTTQQPLTPDFTEPSWQVGFSAAAGGTIHLDVLDRLSTQLSNVPYSKPRLRSKSAERASQYLAEDGTIMRENVSHPQPFTSSPASTDRRTVLGDRLNATELAVLQQLSQPELIQPDGTLISPELNALPQPITLSIWLSIERVLRQYAQYHFDRPIRSATLIDISFLSLPLPLSP